MSAPRQMTDRTLNALHGWPSPSALEYVAEFHPGIPAGDLPVEAGSVVSLNAAGRYVLGVGTLDVMPLFLFHNSDDRVVSNDGGDPATAVGGWVSIMPAGAGGASGVDAGAMSLVGSGAYELVSTAFVANAAYPPNAMLTANLSGDPEPGRLRPGVRGTDTVVGMVSRGVVDNGYGKDALAFWPLPIFP